jgi:hypothetical protein
LHGDDTTVPVLAKGKTDTGRITAQRSPPASLELTRLQQDDRIQPREAQSSHVFYVWFQLHGRQGS